MDAMAPVLESVLGSLTQVSYLKLYPSPSRTHSLLSTPSVASVVSVWDAAASLVEWNLQEEEVALAARPLLA